VLRYRVISGERRVEHIKVVGFVRDFPKMNDARREADRLLVRINEEAEDTRIHFDALAEHYLKSDFGEDAVRPKSLTTVPIVEHYVRDYVTAQWAHRIADDIKPLEIQVAQVPARREESCLDNREQNQRADAPGL
jgi:hypothetical protein